MEEDTLIDGDTLLEGDAFTDEDTLIEEDTLMEVKSQWFGVCCSARFGGLYRTIRDYKGFLKSPLGLCNGPWAAGVLKDAGIRNGSHHGDRVGIYAYASEPYELFNPGDGWCIVTLKCWPFLTRVKGGSRGRYVLKSDQGSDSVGSLCTDCEVTAVLHMYSTLPDFLTF